MTQNNVKFRRTIFRLSLASLCLASSVQAWAQDATADSSLKLSGYVSLVGGKVLGGTIYAGPTQIVGVNCPCYVADWSNAGVYGKDFSFTPESRVGVQVKYDFNRQASVVVQVVSRGTDPTPSIQWAYGSYKLNQNWEVQLGRKRIPLYYYSDFQDIGVSYPWVTPPPELYGWEVTNYNGASLRYSASLGDSNVNASVFTGKENLSDSRYEKLYFPSGKTQVSWKQLIGGDVEVSNGPLTLRAVYAQSTARVINSASAYDDSAAVKAFGLAANVDFDKWFVLAEFTELTRNFTADAYKVSAPAMTVGAGLRLGKWTPFVNYARYTESTTDASKYQAQSYRRASLTVRYDLDANSAMKTQWDRNVDVTQNFGGSTSALRVSYDRVF